MVKKSERNESEPRKYEFPDKAPNKVREVSIDVDLEGGINIVIEGIDFKAAEAIRSAIRAGGVPLKDDAPGFGEKTASEKKSTQVVIAMDAKHIEGFMLGAQIALAGKEEMVPQALRVQKLMSEGASAKTIQKEFPGNAAQVGVAMKRIEEAAKARAEDATQGAILFDLLIANGFFTPEDLARMALNKEIEALAKTEPQPSLHRIFEFVETPNTEVRIPLKSSPVRIIRAENGETAIVIEGGEKMIDQVKKALGEDKPRMVVSASQADTALVQKMAQSKGKPVVAELDTLLTSLDPYEVLGRLAKAKIIPSAISDEIQERRQDVEAQAGKGKWAKGSAATGKGKGASVAG